MLIILISNDLRTYFYQYLKRALDGVSKVDIKNMEHSMSRIGEIRVDYPVRLR